MEIETYSIPTSFKLLGIKYKVQMSKDVIKSKENVCLGMVYHKRRLIKLWNGNQLLQETLFHELAHIYNWLTNAGVNECNGEVFAGTSSLFWCQVFQQIKFKELGHLHKKKKAKAGGKTNGRRKHSRK